MTYNLHSKFNLRQHKLNYIDYLEVVIEPNGTVHYAIPSHQLFLEKLAAKWAGVSQDEFAQRCPQEHWCDYLNWLMCQTKCVCVWSCGYKIPQRKDIRITKAQDKVLDSFVKANVMEDKCLN